MSEYLVWRPRWLNDREATAQMFEAHQVLAVGLLTTKILPEARDFLVNTPGPHREERRRLQENWLSWWIHHLQNEWPKAAQTGTEPLVQSDRIRQFAELEPWLASEKQGKSSGVINFATGEGTEGHRAAVDWMKDFVRYPIALFENPDYFSRHPERRKPFLPLCVRLSLMAYNGVWVSEMPNKPKGQTEREFYKHVFDRTGAKYSFATENDPNLREKISRGEVASFNVIPELASPHTSERTQSLMSSTMDVSDPFGRILSFEPEEIARVLEARATDLSELLRMGRSERKSVIF